jgi:hypothetical protein
LAKENPEAFARLAVGVLPREFEGLPPPVMIFSGVPRRGDEPVAVTTPSLPAVPPVALPQPEAEPDTDRKDDAKGPEQAETAKAQTEPVRAEVSPKPKPIEYEPTGWR